MVSDARQIRIAALESELVTVKAERDTYRRLYEVLMNGAK